MLVKRVTQKLLDGLLEEVNRGCHKRRLNGADVDDLLSFYQKVKRFAKDRELILREVYMDAGSPPHSSDMGTTSTCIYIVPMEGKEVKVTAERRMCRTAREKGGDWGILRANFQKFDDRPWWGITAFRWERGEQYTLQGDTTDGPGTLIIDL